jgi:uncharacterized membrane protein (UPF0127 family)
MRNIFLKTSLLMVLSFSLSACTFFPRSTAVKLTQEEIAQMDRQIQVLYIDQQPITVEIVATSASTTQGLSGRSEIGAEGMLFVFPQQQVRRFWMKDMQFDLDIIWIREGEVMGITANVPAPQPGTSDANLTVYPSPTSVDMVLEVVAGVAEQKNITVGSQVTGVF